MIGKPVLIQIEEADVPLEEIRGKARLLKLGIFQESFKYATTAEGQKRPALDFIHPIYHPSAEVEALAKGLSPKQTRHKENPILSLHMGIDHLKLKYNGLFYVPDDIKQNYTTNSELELMIEKAYFLTGELDYVEGAFANDGNSEIYDKYKEALKKAGFYII